MNTGNPALFAPGQEGVFFDLPAEQYRKAPGVSQSTLKAFGDAGSPLHYKAAERKPSTEDQIFGTLVHAAVLEPLTLLDQFHIQPATYECVVMKCPKCGSVSEAAKCRKCNVDRERTIIEKEWNNGADVCRDWTQRHSDRYIIDGPTSERIAKAADALRNRAGAFSKALASKHARREVSFFKRDLRTELLLKARCDLVVTDGAGDTVIFDIKKVAVGCGCENAFREEVRRWGYHIQAAAYLDITGASAFYFVPFDDDAPFDVNIWSLHPSWLELGRLEYRRLLREFHHCAASGEWLGYHQDGRELAFPNYLKKRIEELTAEETIQMLNRLPVTEGVPL